MNEHLQTLTEIRSLMERSSKFLSLSGLSGISAGLVALIGSAVVYMRLRTDWLSVLSYSRLGKYGVGGYREANEFLWQTAVVVLVTALAFGTFFTVRKARQQGQRVWNQASRRLLWALAVPLVTGGIFCLALLHYRVLFLQVPATLIFYGLALLNGSKYTVRDVEYLAYSEIALGLLALFLTGYNLLFWTVGFGVLHILYGTAMYWKYDRNTAPKTGVNPTS
jgi:predicted lysophospholipase L1 biosynthesis ABC-type transport system permease subunit